MTASIRSISFTALLLLGPSAQAAGGDDEPGQGWRPVSGTGVHRFSTALVHGEPEQTATGFVQRSTEIVELSGDLVGRVLYHPVSVFDLAAGTLVNSGHQVFSGTVLGGQPVLMLDDTFRFEVDLDTRATRGEVFLETVLAGDRRTRCELTISGNGATDAAGDAVVDYEGRCRV
ncbi:MAG: hypothetical protein V2J24_04130 [Pseudomonadales bacterium]|jgi:hypothetical protein|nr:hypothetical protein [Pseudomonadales bacterium]